MALVQDAALQSVPPSVRVAVDRLLLPDIKVRASAAANSRQLEQRFNYLWHAAHNILSTNALLAHQMIASMMEMARINCVELPVAVLDYICECCGALLVPSLSADVRVHPQAHNSRANRKLARSRRKTAAQLGTPSVPQILLNVVRVSCYRCKHVAERAGASEVVKPKTKKRPIEVSSTAPVPAPKRAKTEPTSAAHATDAESSVQTDAGTATPVGEAPITAAPAVPAPRSMFAPPPSPPRKLLDGPKRKKKKKSAGGPDAAVSAVKSSLSSFLQSLRPGTSTK